jgi:hypothetical protein
MYLLPSPAAVAAAVVGCGLSSSHARKLLCSAASSPPQFASALPACSTAAAAVDDAAAVCEGAAAPAASLAAAAATAAAVDVDGGCAAVAGAAVLAASGSVPAGALSEGVQFKECMNRKISTAARQCRVDLPLHIFSQ